MQRITFSILVTRPGFTMHPTHALALGRFSTSALVDERRAVLLMGSSPSAVPAEPVPAER